MDNNYLYIVGFLGILLVAFVVFYFLTSLRKKQEAKVSMNGDKLEKHMTEDHGIECDGDKCIIKPKYDKCDDEKCF